MFVLSLLAMMLAMMLAMTVVPLCYSSILIDRHHPDEHRVRLEINDGRTRNSTLTLTGGKLAGNADFPGVADNGGFFYLPPPPWGGGGGRPSGLFEIDLTILQPVISWLMCIGSALKAADANGEPTGKAPDNAPEGGNDHDQEQSDESEGQENPPPEESDEGNEEGDNGKDDNGEGADNSPSANATTQNLNELANQLIVIIEGNQPHAVFELRDILEGLDMPQRLQVLETLGTNAEGNPVTPLETVLELRRVAKESSLRNRFIEQLILATSNPTQSLNNPDILSELQPIIPPDRAIHEAGDNNLRILHRIVQDIIYKANQSYQQPPIGQFEKCCFTEYLAQLFLIYSNPLILIRNLLREISDSVIIRDIMMNAPSLTLSIPFRETFRQLEQHPSFHALSRLTHELMRPAHTANEIMVSNTDTFTHSVRPVDSSQSASGLATDKYTRQGARPKWLPPAESQTEPSCAHHQTDETQNRASLEKSGVNKDFLNKHSTDASIITELKRRAQEKKEMQRRQMEQLTMEVQRLRTENQALTGEVQGLREENQELTKEAQRARVDYQSLARNNQHLIDNNRLFRERFAGVQTTNYILRQDLQNMALDLRRQQELVDHLLHQAHHRAAARINRTIDSNGLEYSASYRQLSLSNEEAGASNQPSGASAQATRNLLCSHYERLCRVNFGCCEWYFGCHQCHNDSDLCTVMDRKAMDAIGLQCSVCNYEGDITEDSQTCPCCSGLMSDYFCAKCKHFTGVGRKPYHCDKCGVCRTEKDKNFHCDVCNTCLPIGLKNNHKCRPNAGHDQCGICLEDTFDGCIILPCGHHIHRECADGMSRHGIRTCPICRRRF